MSRLGYIALLYLAVIILLAVLSPKSIDWRPTYDKDETAPLGLSILFSELQQQENISLEMASMPLFNELRNRDNPDVYLSISNEYNPDRLDQNQLLKFVDGGGTAFISATKLSYPLMDTLGIGIYQGWPNFGAFNLVKDSVKVYLYQTTADTIMTYVNARIRGGHFESIDSLHYAQDIRLLGASDRDEINFISCKVGDGTLYLHSAPAVFSNYQLLRHKSADYAAACLNYLPSGTWLFDDYFGQITDGDDRSMSVLFQYAPLRWAWNIFMVGMLLFMIFGARRIVRPIPVMAPFENESIKWIKTVGAMHYAHRNNRLVAKKRFDVLKDHLRRRYGVRAEDWASGNVDLLARRVGGNAKMWRDLMEIANQIGVKSAWPPEKLIKFSAAIDAVYDIMKK